MTQLHQTLLQVPVARRPVNSNAENGTYRLRFLAIDSNDERNTTLTEHGEALQDETSASSVPASRFSTTFFIIVTIGFMISFGLVFLWVVRRTSRNHARRSDCDVHEQLESSRARLKRTTCVGSDTNVGCFDKPETRESIVPVLDDNTTKYTMPEALQQERKLSWTEVSTATRSYNARSGAARSNQQSRSVAPMLTNLPAQRREGNDRQALASDSGSHTDDYSIDILESPASTEYSFSSESDDFFPSTCWDVDSYQSASSTFLSTTSSNVFGSNQSRNSGQVVYGPDHTPPIGLGQSPSASRVLFLRNIDPAAMRRMRLDTRVYGARANNQMRLDIDL